MNSGSTNLTSSTTVNQFISTQNQAPSSSNPSTGISSTVDSLTVNGDMSVGGIASINKVEANNITVSQKLTVTTITSSANISIQPFNPSPCQGYLEVSDNMIVNGCFTNLCTTDTYFKDPVPTLNYCNDGILPANDNNDLGFELKYANPNDSLQFTGFMGFDRMRLLTQVNVPRFVFWYDANVFPPDQRYSRDPTATKANGVEADILYTYKITNPDDPNAPAVLLGNNKLDISIDVARDLNINPNRREDHDVGDYEWHKVGTLSPTQAGFRVEDVNNNCNFIELGLTTIPTWQANTTGINGLYLSHDTYLSIDNCTMGNITLGPTNLNITTTLAGSDIIINSNDRFTTTSRNQTIITATNLINGTIQLQSAGAQTLIYTLNDGITYTYPTGIFLTTNNNRDIVIDTTLTGDLLLNSGNGNIQANGSEIYLLGNDLIDLSTFNSSSPININTNGLNSNILLSTISGNITSNATGSDKLVQVDPGIRFISSITSNPALTNPQKTIWYDSTGGNLSNFKTYYPNDATNYPFVVSASENNSTNNKLARYRDNTGWSIEKTNIDSTGDSLSGIVNITMSGNLNMTSASSVININGIQVVQQQQATIALTSPVFGTAGTSLPNIDPLISYNAIVVSQINDNFATVNAQINRIISRLQAHGLIA